MANLLILCGQRDSLLTTVNHWLVKQEPEDYSFARFAAEGRTDWTGVRNFQARNNLRAMHVGDTVLYYHSSDERAIVGNATVGQAAFPDPTMAPDERKGAWVAVVLQAGKAFKNPLPLAAIKADPILKNMALARNSRLSVSPVSPEEYTRILSLTA